MVIANDHILPVLNIRCEHTDDTHIYTCTSAHTQTLIHMHIHIHPYTHTLTLIHMHIHTHMVAYIHTNIICIQVYLIMYTWIRIIVDHFVHNYPGNWHTKWRQSCIIAVSLSVLISRDVNLLNVLALDILMIWRMLYHVV